MTQQPKDLKGARQAPPSPIASATPSEPAPQKKRRQEKVGRVVSNKMDKTIVVAVESLKKHRIYKRTYRQTKRFYAHDEENTCQIGDVVRIEESRPLSKLKRWRLGEVVRRAAQVAVQPADLDLKI